VSGHDLLIIGGGINGLGIAAEASARGLSVLLVEKGDLGGGTTAASSRLIHGGLRYLQYGELGLVRESLRERGILARTRPHLVRPIRLLIPTFRGLPPSPWLLAAGLTVYGLLAPDSLFPPPEARSVRGVREREPGLTGSGLTGGWLYSDGQVAFPERLCVELYREAVEGGAEVLTHTRVTALHLRNGRVRGADLRDALTGAQREAEASLVINAAGPWVDEVNRLLPVRPPDLIGGTWGTHVVLPSRPTGPQGPLYAAARKDGRPFFILPWDGRLLVGTTDVAFSGDPDRVRVQDWEIEYLLSETNRLFPECDYQAADVQFTTVGVRPLPVSRRRAGAITRRHFLVDHGRRHGIEGMASIVGGKLTTYRSLSEAAVDWAVRRLGARPAARPAPPAPQPPEELERAAAAEARKLALPAEAAPRLVALYGPRFTEVLARIGDLSEAGSALAPLEAEVLHAVEREAARTVDDIVRRRLMLLPPPVDVVTAVRRICAARGLDVR
jgi:glycerol-3-phosphate dehydrogenase